MLVRLVASTSCWMLFLLWLSPLSAAPPEVPPTAPPKVEAPAAEKLVAEKPAVEKPTVDKPKEPESRFLRVRRDDKGEPVALETSVVRYVPADDTRPGLFVDLIGAVHVGDRTYYEQLNELFVPYDALLYELVAPEGTRIPKEGRKENSGNPVSALQLGLKSMLELEFQLELVDYTKENFVHADMSPEEFVKSMEKRGESFLQMFFRMMAQGAAKQNADPSGTSDVELLFALFAKDRAFRLKRTMAGQFENMEGAMTAINGPDGSTIITERNKKAFEVLTREIKAGKKKFGVFYGAGHLADMEKRLLAEFGLKRAEEKWIVAWSLERPKTKKPAVEVPAEEPKPAEFKP